MRITSFVFFCFLFLSCDEAGEFFGKEKKEISYSFACLDSSFSGKPINRKLEKASDIIRDIAISKKSITDSMQTAYGKDFHLQMVKEGSFKIMKNNSVQQKLNTVLKDLLAARENPS